ncbi:hypothetical protein [Nostoc sp. UIC 10630]|uniref:hypothetical protein n=1 Tax=Nostoc sp. UIC 10630 TaxID=2100146 RepID=UPI0013D2A0F2|nr:hypothetical protein [Nostoc sp. UIC 10630]NEU83572.1 hypothetical protein [Nostoc sp. UIC 10630]
MAKEYMKSLKAIVDRLTLAAVLEMLEQISYKKAENLRIYCKDETFAKLWDKAARQIEQINIDI